MTIEKVQPLVFEDTTEGGDVNSMFPTTIDPQDDFLEAAGVVLQCSGTNDETTAIGRVGRDMVFTDGNNPSWVTLTQLLAQLAGTVYTGTTLVDFGPQPGASDTRMVIIGQNRILSSSVVEAWISPVATSDHSVDEHRVEGISVFADTIVPGVGFTIFARTENGLLYGQWSVAWMWH